MLSNKLKYHGDMFVLRCANFFLFLTKIFQFFFSFLVLVIFLISLSSFLCYANVTLEHKTNIERERE